MVTPGLAGFPLQAQSTGLSNNIPKRIATSQKGMIVLHTQNKGLTNSMILKESLNTLTAEKVKHICQNSGYLSTEKRILDEKRWVSCMTCFSAAIIETIFASSQRWLTP
jgi:hypothetical protein